MSLQVLSTSVEDTRDLGRRLARRLRSGDIVLLDGPLGAGKTVLVRGVVEGLDPAVAPLVTSQSYVVVGEYPTRPRVIHLDLYRLSNVDEVVALGYEELLYGDDRITLVEWPSLLEPLLEPDDAVLRLTLAHGDASEARRITASSSDARLRTTFETLSGSRDEDGRALRGSTPPTQER